MKISLSIVLTLMCPIGFSEEVSPLDDLYWTIKILTPPSAAELCREGYDQKSYDILYSVLDNGLKIDPTSYYVNEARKNLDAFLEDRERLCGAIANPQSKNYIETEIETQISSFNLPEPSEGEKSKELSLWATYYYTPKYQNDRSPGAIPLLKLDGSELGVALGQKKWCNSALQGSVAISYAQDGPAAVFNFINYGEQQSEFSNAGPNQKVDCSPYFSYEPSGRARFDQASGPYGDGVQGFILFPYRTIAVSELIAKGSVVYIPAARGISITLQNGESVTHDGYFFAADKGGKILDDHIDLFQGFKKESVFQKLLSGEKNPKRHAAFLINNLALKQEFKIFHKVSSRRLESQRY